MTDFLEKLLAQLNGGGAAPRTPAPDSSQVRPEQPQPVAPATPLRAYDGLVNASPMARSVAMDQLRRWKEVLTPGEFVTSKARKLAEVGLTASSPPQTLPVSPMSQQLAIDQVTQFASLVTEGILTEGEYQTVRNVILREHGLA